MRRFRSLNSFIHVALLGACLVSCQRDSEVVTSPDCLVRASATNGVAIAGSYVVTYQPTQPLPIAPGARIAASETLAEQLLSQYAVVNPQAQVLATGEQTNFLAQLTDSEVIKLRQDPSVSLVEPDRMVSMCSCVDVAATSTLTWNVQQTGYGRGDLQTTKTVWIIDTGIDLDHPDLNVDTNRSRSFVSGKPSADDENGHGTHVAGIIGARNNSIGITGVASGATLVSLRVLDEEGEGRLSGIISALTYVVQNGKAGDVVNLSLGGESSSTTLDRAVLQVANAGILLAIAAGNESRSADSYSPSRVNHANIFTVSAMDSQNRFASFSDYGSSVDVCAYGVRIRSTYKNGSYAILSGTSMAAPHVAGLLLIRGNSLPTHGAVTGDPDSTPDPMAGEGN
jgi:subtilisin family serine protease